MNLKGLQRQYGHLSPIERLALALDSLNRNDAAEMEALVRSCPVHEYRLQDVQFWDLHDRSRMIAYLFAGEWFRRRGELETARLGKATFFLVGNKFEKGFGLALGVQGHVPSDKHPVWKHYADALKPFEELWEVAKEAEGLRTAQLKGLHAGFLRFCQMAQLEPHQLLAWTPPLWEEVQEFLETLDPNIEEDQEMAQTIFESFSLLWPGPMKEKNSS